MAKKKKTPLRKCIATNEMKPKKDMIRIVRNKEGHIFVDETGKQNGRGAYVSKDEAVIDKLKQTGILNRQFNTEVDPNIYDQLHDVIKDDSHGK